MKYIKNDIHNVIVPEVRNDGKNGQVYGECSGHLYLALEELYRVYGFSTRFILLIRNPVDFVRSALARGYFSPDHPNGLEHLVPPADTEVGYRWNRISPLEKCAWYWSFVNGLMVRFFRNLPQSMYRIVRIENLSLEKIEDVYSFLGLPDFDEVEMDLRSILAKRFNATPGTKAAKDINPYSRAISLGPVETWSSDDVDRFEKHVLPVRELLYDQHQVDIASNSLSCLD